MTEVCNLGMGIYEQSYRKGQMLMLFKLVQDNLRFLSTAAQQVNMELNIFEEKYRNYIRTKFPKYKSDKFFKWISPT